MINSRDNAKRMGGKLAVVWTNRELVKSDIYALTDKRYMGSFTDSERFYWDVTAELYKRSGGKMDDIPSLARGDGALSYIQELCTFRNKVTEKVSGIRKPERREYL